MKIILPLLFPILIIFVHPSLAVRQGTATADIFIRRYERAGDFGRLALWHEAAAACLKRVSIPMNEIARDYYVRHGYKKWVTRSEKEAREIQEQYQYHRKRAKIAWQKFVGGVCNPDAFTVLNTERENIAKFIAAWLPRYPDQFYEFGIYPTFFRKQRLIAEREGNYVKALQLEADAAAMCATQYEKIPIAYGRKEYEKHRDTYRRHASLLRYLAQQNPKTLPPEINSGKQILDSLTLQTSPPQQEAAAILQVAKADARVKIALADQNGVHAYPHFQGFAWTVRFSNHSRGNLAIAIIDEKTAKVLDVF